MDYFNGKIEKESLVICGGVGVGKTHLSVALLRCMKAVPIKDNQYRRPSGMFMVADEFFMILNDAAVERRSKLSIMQQWLNQYDLFCLDDLGTRNLTEAKLENLYTFINAAYLNQSKIIITTNLLMKDFSRYDDRIPSRLCEMAEIITISSTDYRVSPKKVEDKS